MISPDVPAVEVQGLSHSFRGIPVLEDVDLALEQGGFLGIIGPNGGGKTVFLKILLGLIQPDRGEVSIFGRPPHAARGLVGYVPQFAVFDPDFPISVLDVVTMGLLRRRLWPRYVSAAERQRALEALDQVDLADRADRHIGKLSGGQLQRALVARALAADARLLLLDEPSASLDTRIAGRLYALLEQLSKERTLILVSHDVGVMYRYIKSVGCLNRRLHYHSGKELTQEMVEEAYGCPVDLITHPHTHRVLEDHGD